MGYLLKEALKTLCGVNQWSYAVFWKFGCQNPKLLIWEDCYIEPASCSEIDFQGYNATWISTETRNLQSCVQTGDKVHLLVDKMMTDNQVNIVGEGLVGRVAFSGNYQWILSDNYFRETRPPEVLREICQQFSAGMQTLAVIPILPHGVVQFGSYKTIMENTGFVNDVISLVLQLGNVPGALLSENYTAKELAPKIGDPICHDNSTPEDFSSSLFDSLNYAGSSSQYSVFEQETQNDLQFNVAEYQPSSSIPSHLKMDSAVQNQLINGVAKAEVIPSNSQIWMNQQASLYTPRSNLDLFALRTNNGLMNPTSGTDSISDAKRAAFNFKTSTSSEVKIVNLSKMEEDSNSNSADLLLRSSFPAYSSGGKTHHMGKKFAQSDSSAFKEETQHHALEACDMSKYDDDYVQSQAGDDLFDILGADFKKKIFSNGSESALNVRTWDKDNFSSKSSMASSKIYTTSQGNSESGNFSLIHTDHLLDAVVSKVQPLADRNLDDNVSCKTTVTNTSSSSVANTSLPYGRFGVSDHMRGELFGVPKYLAKAGAMSSCSMKTGSSKEDSRTYSQGSSIYGSQVSSWIENGQKTKQNNSVSTGYSKKPDETGKTNRKRLKPGENPRPRPKDRQMIQDRVKELREIVPNGAKCSIDALLERTIKHMLFLQSVSKHADKLKQTGESKLISKDGGLLLKDNFEGGATWAYEVGSQSMVCPIIVEDLNQPRQMLVEMLCEERGLFLEIADIIRGLGLTILKGIMETRNNKIWARFVVEANRDVTRMEIFISLVRLLEQTAKTGASQPNNINSGNTMVPLTSGT